MEVSVLDIKGQETGRKVALNDAVFGIEPNANYFSVNSPSTTSSPLLFDESAD